MIMIIIIILIKRILLIPLTMAILTILMIIILIMVTLLIMIQTNEGPPLLHQRPGQAAGLRRGLCWRRLQRDRLSARFFSGASRSFTRCSMEVYRNVTRISPEFHNINYTSIIYIYIHIYIYIYTYIYIYIYILLYYIILHYIILYYSILYYIYIYMYIN